jgi:hypothetical protein
MSDSSRLEHPPSHGPGIRKTISEEARTRSQQLVNAWADTNDVKPYQRRQEPCLVQVAEPQHRCHSSRWHGCSVICHTGGQYGFSVLDHPEWWCDSHGNVVLTAHPYGLMKLGELVTWSKGIGVKVSVSPQKFSWYNPDRTYLLVMRPCHLDVPTTEDEVDPEDVDMFTSGYGGEDE